VATEVMAKWHIVERLTSLWEALLEALAVLEVMLYLLQMKGTTPWHRCEQIFT